MWAIAEKASHLGVVVLVFVGAAVFAAWVCGYDERPLSKRARRRIERQQRQRDVLAARRRAREWASR